MKITFLLVLNNAMCNSCPVIADDHHVVWLEEVLVCPNIPDFSIFYPKILEYVLKAVLRLFHNCTAAVVSVGEMSLVKKNLTAHCWQRDIWASLYHLLFTIKYISWILEAAILKNYPLCPVLIFIVYLFIMNGYKNGIVLHIKPIKSGNGYSELDIIPGIS